MKKEKKISQIPRIKKLKKDINTFKNLRRIWPVLRPIAKKFGVDVEKIDAQLTKIPDLISKTEEMIMIPDQFNDMFGELGWILSESTMDLSVAKEAITIAKNQDVDAAERLLVEYFSPEWIEKRKYYLEHIKGFVPRFELAMKALEDYKAGRYYASVLVTLSLIDGWVNDLNIIDHQRKGFFDKDTKLVAFDSMTAHPKGLVILKEVFGKSRKQTWKDEISIPYRHGIMHGMDLGYDNRIVAAKCWAALFAVRDWAVKAARDELEPPEEKAPEEKTLMESIKEIQKVMADSNTLKKWKPRGIEVGRDIPEFAPSNDYMENSPERKMMEFCELWKIKNYGYLAEKAFSPLLCKYPAEARNLLGHMELLDYRLTGIHDIDPAMTDVDVWLKFIRNDQGIELEYTFRLVCTDFDDKMAYLPNKDTVWGVSTWWDKKKL